VSDLNVAFEALQSEGFSPWLSHKNPWVCKPSYGFHKDTTLIEDLNGQFETLRENSNQKGARVVEMFRDF
jgi:hypothetical protein